MSRDLEEEAERNDVQSTDERERESEEMGICQVFESQGRKWSGGEPQLTVS